MLLPLVLSKIAMMFLIVMLAVLLLVIAAAIFLLAYSILSPPRMTDGKALYLLQRLSPADLGMQFETLKFIVRDRGAGTPLEIAAWWIPNQTESEKTVIFVHGYADAKIGAIAWAPTWQKLGYHILAIDLRAHGESAGRFTTAAVFEKHDIDQIINQLHGIYPRQTEQISIFGISMGAAIALAVAQERNDLSAIVLECPFAHFRFALGAHMRFLAMPLNSMLPIVWPLMKQLSGADLDQIDPLKLITSVETPLMIIQSGDDPLVTTDEAEKIKSALASRTSRSIYWHLPGIGHLQALPTDPDEYSRRLQEFLN